MSLEIEFLDKTETAFPEEMVRKVLAKTFTEAGVKMEGGVWEVSVTLVGEKEMAELNGQWLGKDFPTDVLSFAQTENPQQAREASGQGGRVFLGEIILCPAYIEKSAPLQQKSWEWEMAYMISHGLLHLLGYEHGEEMFLVQERVADSLSR
ncbi:MAG TPA: rRNA maturation RNase YbeY [Candidatus Moranbacteria bacterium]|nr:rRNA maturation RNase YbeY [Candidatus Moranbacteria bacterium]